MRIGPFTLIDGVRVIYRGVYPYPLCRSAGRHSYVSLAPDLCCFCVVHVHFAFELIFKLFNMLLVVVGIDPDVYAP